MAAKPSRSSVPLLLPLIGVILIFLLGCAPCCCWPGNFDLKDLKKNPDACTISGTAVITTNNGQSPVPGITVTLGLAGDGTSLYTTTTDNSGYFKINGVKAGTYFIRIAGGDLGWTDTVTLKKGASLNLGDIPLHPTLPPPDTKSSDESVATPEDVIRAYYKAINEGNYSKAMSYISGQLGNVELDTLRAQYEPYVKNIEVVSIERKASMDYDSRQIYFVTFSAEYIKHYAAGSGDLPRMHALTQVNGKWMIIDIGTG